MSKTEKRKVYLIDPPFQKRFLGYTIGSAVAVSLFYFAAVHAFFWHFKAKGVSLGLSADHVFFRFLEDQMKTLDVIFLFATIFMALSLLAYGLYLSNRIAGPLYSLRRFLQKVREGEAVEPLRFRQHDFFQPVAEDVNATLVHLKAFEKKTGGESE